MNRLYLISFINQSWHDQISDFLTEHPAYKRLLPVVAIDEYPIGFNKNPFENDPDCPKNIFETILNGLGYAGADIEYGKQQFLMMKSYFRQFEHLTEDMELPEDTQPSKVPIYRALIKKMNEAGLGVDDLTYDHMDLIESVEGMTESTITLLHLLYDEVTSEKCLPYGDKQFKRGMCMFYNLENPTKEELRAITAKWTNKKVGLMFVVQYAHYSESVDKKN